MLLFAFTGIVRAQNIVKSLERYVPGQGKVTIHQDPRIEALLGTEYVATGEQTILKSPGYRVQVYAGNNSRTARNEATNMASKVKEYFPDLKTYAFFTSPRWLCRVGDDAEVKSDRCIQGSFYCKRSNKYPLIISYVRKRRNRLSGIGGFEKSLS